LLKKKRGSIPQKPTGNIAPPSSSLRGGEKKGGEHHSWKMPEKKKKKKKGKKERPFHRAVGGETKREPRANQTILTQEKKGKGSPLVRRPPSDRSGERDHSRVKSH